jgi:putative serine protease PepD
MQATSLPVEAAMSSQTLERPPLTWTADPPPPPPREPAGVAAAVTPRLVPIAVRTAGQQVEGSGVIIGSDGLIVTNNHVVGTDPATDLAVLQAQGSRG